MIVTPEQDRAEQTSLAAAGGVGLLRQAAHDQVLLERIAFASRHGFSYDGDRDLNKALGRVQRLTFENYWARYRRGGLFKRLIRAAPQATWVSGATIQEDENPEITTAFETAAAELFKRLSAWSRLLRADVLAGLGRYSVLLIGGAGKLEEELSFAPNGPTFLRPISEVNAEIKETEEDVNSERLGLPTSYGIKVRSTQSGRSTSTEKVVHWTRLIHIVDGGLESDVFGEPRGEAVWDLFDDLLKVTGGGSEAAFKNMDPGLNLNIDQTLPVKAADIDKLKNEMLAWQHDPTKRFLLTRGVQVEQLTTSAVNFGPNAHELQKQIAGTAEIPLRILLGSEMGELASSQDERNWHRRMDERWLLFGEPTARLLIDRFIEFEALPKVDEYTVKRPEAEELDDTETAELIGKIADANQKQVLAGDSVVMTSNEMRQDFYQKEPLETPTEPAGLRGAQEPEAEEYDAIRSAAIAAAPKQKTAWLGLWEVMGDALNATELTEALEAFQPNVEEIVDLVDASVADPIADFEEPLEDLLGDVLTDAAERSLVVVNDRGSYFVDGSPDDLVVTGLRGVCRRAIGLRGAVETFNATNPRAVAYAADRAGELIQDIGAETRLVVREIVSQGLAGDVSSARIIGLLRDSVGLREDHAVASASLGSQLRAAEPGSTVLSGGLTIKIPQAGASDAFIERQLKRLTDRQARIRAELIARTETMRAANEGLRETWRQAIEGDQLGNEVRRVWIDAGDDRVRESHAAQGASGEEVRVDEPFSIGVEPGEEPRCRCGQGLVRGAGA